MRIHLHLPDEVAATLARLARQRGLSQSEVVADMLQRDGLGDVIVRLDRIEQLLATARFIADEAAPDVVSDSAPAQAQALKNLRSWAQPDDDD